MYNQVVDESTKLILRRSFMKFEKELKKRESKSGGRKKAILIAIIGIAVVATTVLPLLLGGLK